MGIVKYVYRVGLILCLMTSNVIVIPLVQATGVTSGLVLSLNGSIPSSYNGTTWFDQSTSGTNATQVNGPTYNSADGSFTFNGTNQYFNLGNILNFRTAFSIEVTFSPSALSGNGILVGRQNSFVAGNYFLGVSGSKVSYYVESSPWGILSTSTLATGTKYTATQVYDSNKDITPYLNGVQDGTKTNFSSSLFVNNINLQIGAGLNRSNPSDFFAGKIFSVKIYNRALSAGEVLQNYNALAPDTTAPTFTSSATFSAAENIATSANAATIKASESATITILGGADAALFNIIISDSVTALIRFKASPDFEAPADVGGNNVYEITVRAVDAASNAGTQAITITVTDVVDTSSFNSLVLSGAATFRTTVQITANVTVTSRVSFRVNGKRIAGCNNRLTSGISPNIIAICDWRPARRGDLTLNATAAPTGAGISSATANSVNVRVGNRTGTR